MPDDLEKQLATARRRETALAGVLRSVASAGGDITGLFHDIAFHAARLCDADAGTVFMAEGDEIVIHSRRVGQPDALTVRRPNHHTVLNNVLVDRTVVRFADQSTMTDPAFAGSAEAAQKFGFKSAVYAPVPAGGPPIGIAVLRTTIEPFSDEDVDLLQAFAAQAANALAGAQLVNEVEQRNNDLTAALELQTATAEVLRLISANPGDLQVVLDGILAKATQLCDAEGGTIVVQRGDLIRIEATHGRVAAELKGQEFPAARPTVEARDRRTPVMIEDVATLGDPVLTPLAERYGFHSLASTPLFHDDEWIGNINLTRFEVRAFDPKIGGVLQAFADQAAIAIANARLFNDLADSLARQRAMTEVLDAVSTARTELQPMFDAVAHHAHQLCHGASAALFVRDGDELLRVSVSGTMVSFGGPETQIRISISDQDPTLAAAAATLQPIHVRDWNDVPPDRYPGSLFRGSDRRSSLHIPMSRNGSLVGIVAFTRFEPGGFTDTEVALLQTFANQAAIAVDNARLLQEIEQRNTELGDSLELQTATSEVLRIISAHPGDLRTALDGIVARARALCDADMSFIGLRDGSTITMQAAQGPGTDSLVGREFVIAEDGITKSSREQGVPLFFDDFQNVERSQDDDAGEAAREFNYRSLGVVALVQDDKWIGNLFVGRGTIRPFDPRLSPVLQAFADQAAIAI
ncbi:MAG TPA: GAF domain-containing protein, partial [Ilumatobacter sp.]|nr:GAF domain-containing protein [Ilumatobacter sp.]